MVGARFPSIDPMTTGAGDHDEAGQGHSPAAMPTVVSIHLAPASRLPTRAVDRVVAETGAGLVGDRYHGTRHRHVSVQSLDGLRAAAVDFGAEIDPGLTRRNITISHGVVPTAPGARLSIGDVRLEAVRVAAPCRLLDDVDHLARVEAERDGEQEVGRAGEARPVRGEPAALVEQHRALVEHREDVAQEHHHRRGAQLADEVDRLGPLHHLGRLGDRRAVDVAEEVAQRGDVAHHEVGEEAGRALLLRADQLVLQRADLLRNRQAPDPGIEDKHPPAGRRRNKITGQRLNHEENLIAFAKGENGANSRRVLPK